MASIVPWSGLAGTVCLSKLPLSSGQALISVSYCTLCADLDGSVPSALYKCTGQSRWWEMKGEARGDGSLTKKRGENDQ